MAFDFLQQYDLGTKPEISLPEMPVTDGNMPGQYSSQDGTPDPVIFNPTTPDVPYSDPITFGEYQKPDVFRGSEEKKPGAIFPEQLSVPLTGIWDTLNHPSEGIQTLLGNLKLIPGNPIGEALGSAGRSLEGTPVSAGINFLKDFITSPFMSAGYLLDPSRSEELKRDGSIPITDPEFWNNPFGHLQTNIYNARGQLGAGVDILSTVIGGKMFLAAGKTAAVKLAANAAAEEGTSALTLGFLEKLSQSALVKNSVAVARGMTKPLEGLGKEEGVNVFKDWFLQPAVKPLFTDAAKSEVVEGLSRVATRWALTGTAVGAIEGTAIENLAPGSWAAENIARNRVVDQDSAWGAALDITLGMSLDIFGLGKMYMESAAKAAMAEKMFGPIDHHLTSYFGNWQEAVAKNTSLRPALEWAFNKAMQDAAFYKLLDDFNARMRAAAELGGVAKEKVPGATRANQIGFTSQRDFDAAIKQTIADWRTEGGWKKVYQEAAEVMHGKAKTIGQYTDEAGKKQVFDIRVERPGWNPVEGSDAITRLNNIEDFYKENRYITSTPLGDKYATKMMDRMLRVGTDYDKQASGAIGWLEKHPDEWGVNQVRDFAEKYPAIYNLLDDPTKDLSTITRLEVADAIQNAKIILSSDETFQNILWKQGKANAEYNRIRRAILESKGEVDPQLLRNKGRIEKYLADFREAAVKQASELADKFQADITAREAEIAAHPGMTPAERIASASHLDELRGKLSDAMENVFDMAQIGTRYEIGYKPTGVINKVFSDTIRVMPEQGRNTAGRMYDRLFGGVSNVAEGLKAYRFMQSAAERAGIKPSEWSKIMNEASERALEGQMRIRGMSYQFYRNLWDLPPGTFESIVKKATAKEAPAGFKSWGEVLYRAKNSPIRMAQENILGKEYARMPYNKAFHAITRSYFPIVKFSLSPRFLLMTMFDQDFYKTFLGGSGAVNINPELVTKLRALAENMNSVHDFSYDSLRSAADHLNDIAHLAAGRASHEIMNSTIEAIYRSPQHMDLFADYGIKSKEQLVTFLERLGNDRDAFLLNRTKMIPAEEKIAKQIEVHQKNIDRGMLHGEWLNEKAAMDLAQQKLDEMRARRMVSEANAKAPKDTKVTTRQATIRRMWDAHFPDATAEQRAAIEQLIKDGTAPYPIAGGGYASDLKIAQGKLAPESNLDKMLKSGKDQTKLKGRAASDAADAAAGKVPTGGDVSTEAFERANKTLHARYGSIEPYKLMDSVKTGRSGESVLMTSDGKLHLLEDASSGTKEAHLQALRKSGFVKGPGNLGFTEGSREEFITGMRDTANDLTNALRDNGMVRVTVHGGYDKTIRGLGMSAYVGVEIPRGSNLSEAAIRTLRALEKESPTPLDWDVSSLLERGRYTQRAGNGQGVDKLLVELRADASAMKPIGGGSTGGESGALLRNMAIKDDRFQPFLDAITQAHIDSVKWARQVLMGNPERTTAERLMNSFLLYWPISYQIKATKAMMGFMLDRGFGFKTNAAPAVIAAEVHKFHDERYKNDPTYAHEWDSNKQWNFLLKNLFPATPDEVGVSLSPVFRAPLQVARGYKDVPKAFDSAVNNVFGAKRDLDQAHQILVEQLKDGHLLNDFLDVMGKAFGANQKEDPIERLKR